MNIFSYPTPAKWWVVEVEFNQPIGLSNLRKLEHMIGADHLHQAYCNYDETKFVWHQWPEKWPQKDDHNVLMNALDSIRIPYKIRAAPFGHGCTGVCQHNADDDICTTYSNVASCNPIMPDWILVDKQKV